MKIKEIMSLLAELDPELEMVTPRDRDGGINFGFTPLQLVDTNRYKLIWDESEKQFEVYGSKAEAEEFGHENPKGKDCIVLDWEV